VSKIVKIWTFAKKLFGPLKWIYLQVKPATLSLHNQDIVGIESKNLLYTFEYLLHKGKWSKSLSKKNIVMPLGPAIELMDLEIIFPPTLRLIPMKIKLSQLNAISKVYEVVSPYLENLKDGDKITVTVVTPFDVSKYITRNTSTMPKRQEIIFKNLLSRPVKQFEISLDITKPYPIKNIEIQKGSEDVGSNKYLQLETRLVQDLKISNIQSKFPNGISTDYLVSSSQSDVYSCIKILIDFDPGEEIKIIIYR